jgi:hypothetical protein
MSWTLKATITDQMPFYINKLNIWDFQWIKTGESFIFLDPIYLDEHIINIYQIFVGERIEKFAAHEFSNTVWGIFLEED